jgi:membrane-associated phospholipid phosphatase
VFLAAIFYTVFGQSIKYLADVPRPPQFLQPHEFHLIGPDWGQHAFPSGHASMVFILAGVFSFITTRIWLRIALILGASLVSLSRVVVGVHWPLDILAGALIGWVAIWVALLVSERSLWAWRKTGTKIMGAVLLLGCLVLFAMDYTGYDDVLLEQRILAVCFFLYGGVEYLKLYGVDLAEKIPRFLKKS